MLHNFSWNEMYVSRFCCGNNFFVVDCVKDDGVNRKVQLAEGQELAKRIGSIAYFETSSKTGENVKEAFQAIVDKYAAVSGKPANAAQGNSSAATVDVNAAHHGSSSGNKSCCG